MKIKCKVHVFGIDICFKVLIIIWELKATSVKYKLRYNDCFLIITTRLAKNTSQGIVHTCLTETLKKSSCTINKIICSKLCK